jgi:hypothetical protein
MNPCLRYDTSLYGTLPNGLMTTLPRIIGSLLTTSHNQAPNKKIERIRPVNFLQPHDMILADSSIKHLMTHYFQMYVAFPRLIRKSFYEKKSSNI